MKFSIKKNYLISIIASSIILGGCGSSTDTSTKIPKQVNNSYDVEVYSLGPVLRASVKDAKGNLATQSDSKKNIYSFQNPPLFPITATGGDIDVNRDGQITPIDIKSEIDIESGSGNYITLITDIIYEDAKRLSDTKNSENNTTYTAVYDDTNKSIVNLDLEVIKLKTDIETKTLEVDDLKIELVKKIDAKEAAQKIGFAEVMTAEKDLNEVIRKLEIAKNELATLNGTLATTTTNIDNLKIKLAGLKEDKEYQFQDMLQEATINLRNRFNIDTKDMANTTPYLSNDITFATLSESIYTIKLAITNKIPNLFNSDINSTFNTSLDSTSYDDYYIKQLEFYKMINPKVSTTKDNINYNLQYSSLKLLDVRLANRSNEMYRNDLNPLLYLENTTPHFTQLSKNKDKDLSYWGLDLIQDNILAIASGNDGLHLVNKTNGDIIDYGDINKSMGWGLKVNHIKDNDGFTKIFVADKDAGVSVFDFVFEYPQVPKNDTNQIVNPIPTLANYSSYKAIEDGTVKDGETFDVEYFNNYSENQKIMFIANYDNSKDIPMEILNIDNTLTFTPTFSVFSLEKINKLTNIRDFEVANNKQVVYGINNQGINVIDTTNLNQFMPINNNSPKPLDNNDIGYELKLFPNAHKMVVSTNKGIQIWDTTNPEDLKFLSRYDTSGAKDDTTGENIRIAIDDTETKIYIADIYEGIKIIDIKESTNPKLCGLIYTSGENPQEVTANRDILFDDGKLYITNDSNGLISIDANKFLFKHCK